MLSCRNSAQDARAVIEYTGADAVMIGRAAQGRPWIFREINHYLATGEVLAAPGQQEISQIMQDHLTNLYEFYGEYKGVRIARKHIGWYCKSHQSENEEQVIAFRKHINAIEDAQLQLDEVMSFFNKITKNRPIAAWIIAMS